MDVEYKEFERGYTVSNVKTIGVIGAGQMGNGIAHVGALAGYDIILNDIKRGSTRQSCWTTIKMNMVRQVSRGRISERGVGGSDCGTSQTD